MFRRFEPKQTHRIARELSSSAGSKEGVFRIHFRSTYPYTPPTPTPPTCHQAAEYTHLMPIRLYCKSKYCQSRKVRGVDNRRIRVVT
eukprot:scaffold13896_cov120-Isochrysis_galbana.AAC.7